MSEEEKLVGGNVADSVVRIGSTVRKPATLWLRLQYRLSLPIYILLALSQPHKVSDLMSVDGRSLSSYQVRCGTESTKTPWPIYGESAF
jgi:hypothetical protein